MRNTHRIIPLLLVTIALFIGVMLLSPQQLPTINTKLLNIALGGIAAFWFDVLFFPYARPDGYLVNPDYRNSPAKIGDADCPIVCGYRLVFAAAMLRRAIIVGAAILAVSLGL